VTARLKRILDEIWAEAKKKVTQVPQVRKETPQELMRRLIRKLPRRRL